MARRSLDGVAGMDRSRRRLALLLLLLSLSLIIQHVHALHKSQETHTPIVISTWRFIEAVKVAARHVMEEGGSAVDAVVHGCSTCELLQCDGSVGYGGSPDESGETTLDAMIMDGIYSQKIAWQLASNVDNYVVFDVERRQTNMNVGAVGALRSVKGAIEAAKLVMEHTEHTLLVGDQASQFALALGLPGPANLSTAESLKAWSVWRESGCQPNYWCNVVPDSSVGCGPYRVSHLSQRMTDNKCEISDGTDSEQCGSSSSKAVGFQNHDTISMAVIDKCPYFLSEGWGRALLVIVQRGRIAAGTSTNGASHKIPGRVGDGPIVGAAAYADDDVGACGATGDGDVMMRFLPCYQVVESMRQGMDPASAAKDAIARIRRKYPSFIGAVFAVNRLGVHAGACHGWLFQYSVKDATMNDVQVFTVHPDA